MGSGGAHGCGHCLPCRIKRGREWTHRLMLERSVHKDAAFLTLTYAEDRRSLEPLHLRAFLDRFRKITDKKIRYYAVGEYGDTHGRPHYHVALFNHSHCTHRRRWCDRPDCKACNPIRQAWSEDGITRGFILAQPMELGRAKYIAKYTIKKLTRFDDPRLLPHQHPEFARMSNQNGGIGYGALEEVANTIRKFNLLTPEGDVPVTLRHGTQQMPIGRYLRQALRKKLGLDHRSPHVLTAEASYAHSLSEEGQNMRALQQAAVNNKTSLKTEILNQSAPLRAQITSRHKLHSKKGEL